MIAMLLSLLLAVGTQDLIAQAGSQSSSKNDAAREQPVDPAAAVITISGICGKSSPREDSQPCKTVVSREQFERMLAALAVSGQSIPANARQQLAQAYVDLLAFEQAARPSGLESSPAFQDLMELIRLRTLSEVYRRNLQARSSAPSPEDVDQYYQQNSSEFIEIKLRRLMAPRKNPAAANQTEYEKRALEVMNDLHERAARGEDFDQLQKEAYTRLGLAAPPGTDMGARRKANLLPDYRDEILSLEPGNVSKVKEESFSYVIYKIDGKKLLPKETVREEISREITKRRLDNALKEIMSGVEAEFNQQYFSPPSATEAKHPPGPLPR